MPAAPDPMFRQRLRNYWRDTLDQMNLVEPGSRAWHKMDAMKRAIEVVHVEVFKEAIAPLHNGPHPEMDKSSREQ